MERRVSFKTGGWLASGLLLGCALWAGLRAVAVTAVRSPAAPGSAATSRPAPGGAAWQPPGRGFLVWESNRSGRWRLWTQRLDGSGLRQLTPDEGERIHCCPHASPDGTRLTYLSLPPGPDRYPENHPEVGELRLLRLDGSGSRILAPAARAYGEHRAVMWHGDGRLVFLDGAGHTVRLDLGSGQREPLTARPHSNFGWLIDPTLRHAVDGQPSFPSYDPRQKAVTRLQAFGGCQPYITPDGRWGYWVAGAGGPIDKIDLATREVTEMLGKSDPRMPGRQGYMYFPMLSPDRRLLAFGASEGGHDHWRADYDIYVAEVHPATLDLVGAPVRFAAHPGTDRFPTVWLDPKGARPVPSPPRRAPRPAVADPQAPSAWPADRTGLAFLWETGDAPNRVFDPAAGAERSFPVERRGLARLDRWSRMDLGGGSFVAGPEASAAVVAAVQGRNELTLEATLTPRASRQDAAIVALSGGGERANLVLAQKGDGLVVRLVLALRGLESVERPLGRLAAGRPTHVVVSYRPGHLQAFRDGRSVLDTREVQGDFFRWRPRPLTFGTEARSQSAWSGVLEGIAFYGRALAADEAAANARLHRATVERRAAVPSVALRGRLTAVSRTPTLREISPYREALAVFEYEKSQGGRVRVAQWVILDGEALPAPRVGETAELRLEPFAAQPQLESVFLSDTLPAAPGLALQYAVR